MIWIILISLLILLLIWVLVVPVIIYMDTYHNRYILALPGIFKAIAVPSEYLFHIRGRIFCIPFTYNPFLRKPDKKKKEKETEKSAEKRRLKKTLRNLKLVIRVLRSFKIRKLELNIDTDDFMLNAWLITVFSTVNSRNIQMRANFMGYASLLFDLRIRIGTLLWIFIMNKIKSF
jgi:hypothetical protein